MTVEISSFAGRSLGRGSSVAGEFVLKQRILKKTSRQIDFEGSYAQISSANDSFAITSDFSTKSDYVFSICIESISKYLQCAVKKLF